MYNIKCFIMQKRRIVITGIGPVTPVGTGNDYFWKNLIAGKSGISKVKDFESPEWQQIDINIAGEVKDFLLDKHFTDPKLLKSMNKDMDRVTQFAVVAAKLAIDDSLIDFSKLNTERVSTFVGTGIGGIQTTCADQIALLNGGQKKSWGQKYNPSYAKCTFRIHWNSLGLKRQSKK